MFEGLPITEVEKRISVMSPSDINVLKKCASTELSMSEAITQYAGKEEPVSDLEKLVVIYVDADGIAHKAAGLLLKELCKPEAGQASNIEVILPHLIDKCGKITR